MFFTDDALLHDMKFALEQRFGKVLSPGAGLPQQLGSIDTELIGVEHAVGKDFRFQIRRGE